MSNRPAPCRGPWRGLLLGVGLLLAVAGARADDPIARFGVIQGVVSVQHQVASQFTLAVRGAALAEGDVVITERDSIAQIVFSDGSQIALRPGSRLAITRYHFDTSAPKSDSMVLDLLRGGLRTLTGLIGKRGDRDVYHMNVGHSATIGIRGTDFVARLCQADCAEEEEALSSKHLPASEMPVVVARVAELADHSSAVTPGKPERPLFLGAPLYNGDRIDVATHAHVTALFTDGTRVVLEPGSRFLISNYRYDTAQPEGDAFLVSLLRGGLRSVTGLIGHINPKRVSYRTQSATIGVRGTAFDIRCAPLGEGRTLAPEAPAVDCDQTVVVHMREGTTSVQSGENILELGAGQTAIVDGPGAVPQMVDSTPTAVSADPLPVPELLTLDAVQIFGPTPATSAPGVYAAVFDGSISLSQNGTEIILGPGEAGFANLPDASSPGLSTNPIELGDVPGFVRDDTLLQNFDFDPMACVVQ